MITSLPHLKKQREKGCQIELYFLGKTKWEVITDFEQHTVSTLEFFIKQKRLRTKQINC